MDKLTLENILEKLPEIHAKTLKNVIKNIDKEKNSQLKYRIASYFRGYVNCLKNVNLITVDEFFFLNHQLPYEKK